MDAIRGEKFEVAEVLGELPLHVVEHLEHGLGEEELPAELTLVGGVLPLDDGVGQHEVVGPRPPGQFPLLGVHNLFFTEGSHKGVLEKLKVVN